VDLHLGWLSEAVENVWLALVGIVVLRSMIGVATPPSVSMPSVSGVTSSSRTSLTSPLSTPAWMAAPMATTSSGFTPLCGSLPKNSCTFCCTERHARHAADQDDLVDVARLHAGVGERLPHRLQRAVDEVADELLELRARQRDVHVLRPRGVRVMNGRLISVCCVEESSIFAFSAASFRRCSAVRSCAGRCPSPS
jgi:hypothetical protein